MHNKQCWLNASGGERVEGFGAELCRRLHKYFVDDKYMCVAMSVCVGARMCANESGANSCIPHGLRSNNKSQLETTTIK